MIPVELPPAVSVDENVLIAELLPGGERMVFRGRYQWTECGRSILAEEVKNEIYDGAALFDICSGCDHRWLPWCVVDRLR